MNKKIIVCIACALIVIGCKRVSVDFTFSPTEPRAGQAVKFTNNSSAGESWNWDFGDNITSVLKNPSHTFKKPGTYVVTLMVDSAKYNTCSHTVVVYDTVPTFTASTDSICHFTDVTLTANVYNPYSHYVSYEWVLPQGCHLVSGALDSKSVVVYFENFGKTVSVSLNIKIDGKPYSKTIEFNIHETKAPAIVMQRTNNVVARQRIIHERWEPVQENRLEENVTLLHNTNDTVVTFNGVTFYANQMATIFPDYTIRRLQIDANEQKWYITTDDGLFVANFQGEDIVCIDAEATGGLFVDASRNLVFWATPAGLKAMALVKSKKNQFSTTPILCNELSDIDRIVVNNHLQ